MRLAIISTLLFAAMGIPVAYYWTASKDAAASTFSEQYLLAMEKHPDVIIQHMETLVEKCLPEARFATQPARRLMAETYSQSILLTAQQKSDAESAELIVPWILDHAKPLSASDRTEFLKLARQINSVEIHYCFMSGTKNSAVFKLNTSAAEWNLRL